MLLKNTFEIILLIVAFESVCVAYSIKGFDDIPFPADANEFILPPEEVTLDQCQTFLKNILDTEKTADLRPVNHTKAVLVDGDTCFYEEDLEKRRKKRQVVPLANRWQLVDKIVPKKIRYYLDKDMLKPERAVVIEALQHFENETCIHFEDKTDYSRDPKRPYIRFVSKSSGCFSKGAGLSRFQPQYVNMGKGCSTAGFGTAWHEIAHVMGLFHEHRRPDRNAYVKWNQENTMNTATDNFKVCSEPDCEFDVSYDYSSVMHYSPMTFSIDKYNIKRITLDPVEPEYFQTIGNRKEPTFNDVKQLNQLYCHNMCPNDDYCFNGGYRNPNQCAICQCPNGFAPPRCEQIEQSEPKAGICGGDVEAKCGWQDIGSSKYKTTVPESKCVWKIEAPKQRDRVEFELTDKVYIYPYDASAARTCRQDFVEVKYKNDMTLGGARVCDWKGMNAAKVTKFTSESRRMMLLMIHQKDTGFYGFKPESFEGRFRAVGPSCGQKTPAVSAAVRYQRNQAYRMEKRMHAIRDNEWKQLQWMK